MNAPSFGNLVMSFYGPFAALLNRNPIEICAPRCIGHYAGIFSVDDEQPLEKDRLNGKNNVFELTQSGIISNATAIKFPNLNTLLSPPQGAVINPDVCCAYFCMKLPRPTHVIGLSTHPVRIVGTNAPAGQSWATGFRLVFDYDLLQPVFELSNANKSAFKTTLNDYSDSKTVDITVRHVGPLLIDPDNDDAVDCFESSTNVFLFNGAKLDWKLDYFGNKMGLLHRTGGDCGAPNFVMP